MTLDDEPGGRSKVPAPRSPELPSVPRFVAPVTLGRPVWKRRYLRSTLVVDTLAVAFFPVVYLLCRGAAPLPLLVAAMSVVVLWLVGRLLMRTLLHRRRRRGEAMSTMLVVGTPDDVSRLTARTRRVPALGWRVDGACTSSGSGPDGAAAISDVSVLGDLDSVPSVALTGGFDAVAVCPSPGWTQVRLQQLAWDLDGSRTALLVDPRLVAQVHPDVQVAGVEGLPLVHLIQPTLAGPRRVAKELTDRVGALLILLVVAPVLVSCALAVRRDGGPALERRARIGRNGRTFSLLTFRTTTVDTGRRTTIGRVLRDRCLDELPQLLNVVGGSMALVGPRPSTPAEFARFGCVARQHLLIKPGITGLWLVGDDKLPLRERARLHLRYAEAWTPALDARILVGTVRTALSRRSSH